MLKRLAVLILLFAVSAEAKDMRQRLGVGMKNSSHIGTPMVAAVYYPSNEVAVTGGFGIDTRKDNSELVLNIGVRRIIFKEQQLNFYYGGHLSMVNEEVNTEKQSGWELAAVAGAEFFFEGLDNLGFTFEAGFGAISMKEVRFATLAQAPFQAGIVFYF